jgi:hypothetical protein
MQKFLTLYVQSTPYSSDSPTGMSTKYGEVKEHLADYLSDGWKVVSVTALGGTAPGHLGRDVCRGDFAVVIEKPTA